MTSSSSTDAKDLITLAERMGIPVDEAIRQVAQLIADVDHAVAPANAPMHEPMNEAVASSAVA